MITNIEQLLKDYASYSFMEGTIDENTMNHLIEGVPNYIAKLNELKLLSLHIVVGQSEQLVCPNCDGEGFSGKGTNEILPCLSCFGSGERAD